VQRGEFKRGQQRVDIGNRIDDNLACGNQKLKRICRSLKRKLEKERRGTLSCRGVEVPKKLGRKKRLRGRFQEIRKEGCELSVSKGVRGSPKRRS